MAKTILVLGDGETWDIPENCSILTITDWAYDQIESGQMKAKNLANTKERIDILYQQEVRHD